MLTDEELHRPYLNPGVIVSREMLAPYWSLILERPVTLDEVNDALRRQAVEWCVANPVECKENEERWARLLDENIASHASGRPWWRNPKL